MIKFEALVNAIQDAVVKANDALMDKNVGLLDTYFEKDTNSEGEDVLTPKVYNLKYPKPTNNGIVMIDVEVPLLTLAPMVTSQIEELKFNTNLEVTLVNDELHVGFPSDAAPKRRLFEKSSDRDGRPLQHLNRNCN